MPIHTGDGRVRAKDKRTGKIVREHPHVIKLSPFLELAPSEEAKNTSTQQVTEPARGQRAQGKATENKEEGK